MTLLIVTLFLAILLFKLYFRYNASWMASLGALSLSLFFLELFSFLVLVVILYMGQAALLVGQSSILDSIIGLRTARTFYSLSENPQYFWAMDNSLGYRVGRNKRYSFYTSNSAGMRGQREYSFVPQQDKFRLATFGDSFIFGNDQQDADTWQSQLELRLPGVEVLNFGTAGYGFQQSTLHYLQNGVSYFPHLVVFNSFGFHENFDFAESYLEALDDGINRTDFYHPKLWIENGILRWKGYTISSVMDPEWRESFIYRHIPALRDESIRARALNSRLLSFSFTTILLRQIALKSLANQAYAIEKTKRAPNRLCDPVTIKLVSTLYEFSARQRAVLLFLAKDPYQKTGDQLCGGAFPAKPAHVFFFNPESRLVELRGDKYSMDDIISASGHYNTLGNQMYAQSLEELLKSRTWKANGNTYFFDKKRNVMTHNK